MSDSWLVFPLGNDYYHQEFGSMRLYGPDKWSAEEVISCVEADGASFVAEQNNWDEEHVMKWYEDALHMVGPEWKP